MKSSIKKSLLWVIAAFLLYVLVSALRIGTAELVTINATSNMEGWAATSTPPSSMEVEYVSKQFEIALFLNNDNPTLHENFARLSLMRSALPGVQPDEKRALLVSGLSEIRTSIRLRPTSPYSWTTMLAIKRNLGEYDAEFRHGLHRAVELGPWEPQLLSWLADVGLSAWDKMPPPEQALIQQVFVRGLERQVKLISYGGEAFRESCAERKDMCPMSN